MEHIAANLRRIQEAIATAAVASGRDPQAIKLIAVSKTQPPQAIDAAVRAGQTVFGESTVQEALTKIPRFQDRNLEWHFIGHLQSNKAKFIPGNFHWVHSLDSVKLARRLSRLAQTQRATINALIEINVTGDPNKHGIAPNELLPLLEQFLAEDLPAVCLRGLMAIGPYPATDAAMHSTFAAVRRLRDEAQSRLALPHFTELSMGMSGDYVAAIHEGASMVRLGAALFGARDYGT